MNLYFSSRGMRIGNNEILSCLATRCGENAASHLPRTWLLRRSDC